MNFCGVDSIETLHRDNPAHKIIILLLHYNSGSHRVNVSPIGLLFQPLCDPYHLVVTFNLNFGLPLCLNPPAILSSKIVAIAPIILFKFSYE